MRDVVDSIEWLDLARPRSWKVMFTPSPYRDWRIEEIEVIQLNPHELAIFGDKTHSNYHVFDGTTLDPKPRQLSIVCVQNGCIFESPKPNHIIYSKNGTKKSGVHTYVLEVDCSD